MQEVWEIFRADGLYLINLNFFIGIQLLVFGGGLTLFYFGNLPRWFTLLSAIICLGIFNISLTGVSKNLFALSRERGPGKYPVFHRSYLVLGLPLLLSYLLIGIVPILIIVAMVFALLAGAFAYWPYIFAVTIIFCLLWQWLLGLASSVILDTRVSLPDAIITSFRLVLQKPWQTLLLVIIDFAILIVGSFIPVVGTFAAINWIIISAGHLYWGLK